MTHCPEAPVTTRSCSMRPRSLLHSQGPRSSIASSITAWPEGDTLDFSAFDRFWAWQRCHDTLVRVLENPSGTAAILQIDQDGTTGGMNWTTIARLDGIHTGDGVNVILDSTGGVTLTVPELMPTKNFNGDTHADILWQSSSGMPAAWLMNGTNAVTVSGVGSFNPGPSWHVKGSGDFNGDGKSDILWQDSGGTPAIWLMDGTTAVSVSAAGSFNPGPSWQIKGTGDFNGDGKSDILWQDSGGAAAIWLMDGTTATSVAAVGPFNPGPSWQIKGTGDFNGDGKSDILWQGSDGTPAIWLMDGINFVSTSAAGSFNPGPSWQVKGSGDFNGDGKSDILWQGSDGTPAIWLMDGATAVTVSAAGSVQPGAELACQGRRRLQRRRQVGHPVAGQRWHPGDLVDGRHPRGERQCRRLVQPGHHVGCHRLEVSLRVFGRRHRRALRF